MTPGPRRLTRRRLLAGAGGLAAGVLVPRPLRGSGGVGTEAGLRHHPIPSSGEKLPVIGLGTYITFNVGPSEPLRQERCRVLQEFLDLGGGLVDSSPMYGSSEEVLGYCLRRTSKNDRLFSATKVWTGRTSEGPVQVSESEKLWGLERLDLEQVHNLVNREAHLRTLQAMKEEGRIRYTGVTTSHGRRHRELEAVLRNEPVDFVQLTYNILDRETEERLIPLAAERGVAVIANRPYRGGSLMDRYQREPFPEWAREAGMRNWAEYFLKYIVSLPGVTCAIPATSKVAHLRENMGALHGPLPDARLRHRMAEHLARL